MEMESLLIDRYREIASYTKKCGENSSNVSLNDSDSDDESVEAYDGFACINVTNLVGV